MLQTKAFFYGKLSTDSALISLLGSTNNISDAWPEVVNTFPMVIIMDDNQRDWEFVDNKPKGSSVTVTIHIFTKAKAGAPTTSAIGSAVALVFYNLDFACTSNGEVSDPVPDVRHRIMRFSRELFPSELI